MFVLNTVAIMRIQTCLFTLILIHTAASEARSRLSPPINVSIQCDNYGVEVRWQYPYPRQNVSFQVEVKDKDKIWEPVTTEKNSLNISSMLWNPAYNHYVVTVMAMWGTHTSEKAESVIFSFNQNAASKIKCQLDFPKVKLSPKEGKLHLEFSNPLQLYRNTPALRNLNDLFEYSVVTEEGKEAFRCELNLATCETSIQFREERQKYCVSLTGNIGQRQLKPTSGCYEGDIKSYLFLYPVLGGILALLFIAGLLLLLAKKLDKKMKKKAAYAFPKSLEFEPTQTHFCNPLILEPKDVPNDLQIEPPTYIGDSTLLTEIFNEDQSSDCSSTSVSSDHSSNNVQGTFNESDNLSTSDLSAGYDCPHVLRQEISPGDMVEVYRANKHSWALQ
ncbi:interferon gamma receptor 1-like [Myxocyprinus asiaticus]|uniref:interferon gamma receptor 1-like n=1 Tax=Myxocyprinus asiaticus TaxID=70543 RepID=UPI002222ADCE|nr:interferon gamma receptor 1-like [Myxocyprinus asiaticus]